MSGWEEREARSVALEKAYVHEVYDQISAHGRAQHRGRIWPKVSQFLDELEPGSLVCDVGCGNGKYLNVNPSIFKIGADRCQTLVNSARKKDHEALLCDNLSLPFRDESFDAVLSVAVVHHFATTERRVGAIRELARVLRIGGRLVITVWAMEQRHRKFESQDVLVPWHRQQQLGASLDFTSATTTASEEETPGPCRACAPTPARDLLPPARFCLNQKKRGKSRHKSCYSDLSQPSSPGSSSLSSPNETCYSFVRRALQKLAGSTKSRSRVRPWFLESWSSCAKEEPLQRHDPEGCEGAEDDGEDIQDLPIELRRLEEDQQEVIVTTTETRQTFTCVSRQDSTLGHKSKSLTDILNTGQRTMVRSRSSVPSLSSLSVTCATPTQVTSTTTVSSSKPKLVKQKKSICDEEMEDEGRDEPTDMRDLVKALPEFRVTSVTRRCGSVFKQSSMNEELMSTERLREKERVRQNIQKQASLNEELIFRRNRTLDSLKDTFFSTSTAKRFQILKNGFTSKLKSSTTGIEKVAGTSFKNGFVRILQGWKGSEAPPQPEISPNEPAPSCTAPSPTTTESKRTGSTSSNSGDDKKDGARRHSREDGSDSSKDSSLQSDTSVDSEDSFASVIFVPKQELQQNDSNAAATATRSSSPVPTTSPKSPQLPTLPKSSQVPPASPKNSQTPPVSPKATQATPTTPKCLISPNAKPTSSTSPNAKSAPPTSPTAKSNSLSFLDAKSTSLTSPNVAPNLPASPTEQDSLPGSHPHLRKQKSMSVTSPSLGKPLPSVPSPSTQKPVKEAVEKKTSPNQPVHTNLSQDLLCVKPAPVISRVAAAGVSSRSSFPLVRRSSAATPGRADWPMPRLLSLELFNPETDDMDSDSSGVSSPDSVSSVISVLGDSHFQEDKPQLVVEEAESNPPTEDDMTAARDHEPQVSPSSLSLLEAAADVASSLEETVDAVIQSSPRARRRQLQLLESSDPMAVLQDGWSLHTSPVNPDGAHHQGKRSPGRKSGQDSWDEDCRQHLAEFAEKLSEKLLEEIDQYRQQTCQQQRVTKRLTTLPEGFDHMNDPYLERLSEELNDLTRLSEELQERKSYIASLNSSQEIIPSLDKLQQDSTKIPPAPLETSQYVSTEEKASVALVETKAVEFCPKQMSADDLEKFSNGKDGTSTTRQFSPQEETVTLLPRNIMLKADYSLESSDAGDASEITGSCSDCSRRDTKTPSTTSLGPESSGSDCSKDLRFADRRTARCDGRSSSEEAPVSTNERESFQKTLGIAESRTSLSGSTSQESLPSDSGGGAITFHRYYHVFREGELDQLIERYAENLHIISSYYDHANWCVVAEKVQVWTI